jgi:hypothetical protein
MGELALAAVSLLVGPPSLFSSGVFEHSNDKGEAMATIHPVVVRVLKFKLGEKLTKEEQQLLALEYVALVTGKTPMEIAGDVWTSYLHADRSVKSRSVKPLAARSSRVLSSNQPKLLIDAVMEIVDE